MTGYVVHYRYSAKSVTAFSTSSTITGLSEGLTYTFIIEAISEHISGKSTQRSIKIMCKCKSSQLYVFPMFNNTGYLSVSNNTGSANATGSNTNSTSVPCLGIISYLCHYCYVSFQYWSLIQNQQELFLQPIRQRKPVSSSSESLQ